MNGFQKRINAEKYLKYECASYGLPFHGNIIKGVGWAKWRKEKQEFHYFLVSGLWLAAKQDAAEQRSESEEHF